jgi:hypothetical protein
VSALARGMIAQRRAVRRTVRCISQGYWFESSRRSFYQGFMPWAALFDHQLPLYSHSWFPLRRLVDHRACERASS